MLVNTRKVDWFTHKFIQILSLAGFLVQVIQVSQKYFAYTTSTQTKLSMAQHLDRHDIAICIRYNEILDIERLKQETGITIVEMDGNHTFEEAMMNEEKLTIKQIFDYTPSSDDLMEGCMFRPNNWDINVPNASICGQYFHLSRYFAQERMCYVIRPAQTFDLRRSSVTLSTFYPYVIFAIQFNSKLEMANMVNAIAFNGSLPHYSREFSSPPAPLFASNKVKAMNSMSITYNDVQVTLLPPPYDTMCVNVDLLRKFECNGQCLTKEMVRVLKRVPAWEPMDRPVDFKPLSLADIRENGTLDVMDKIRDKCWTRCDFIPCVEQFSKTESSLSEVAGVPMAITVTSPRDPDIIINASETMSFIDYFTYITSCFGTWFGLSFLSLNPFRSPLLKKRRRRQRRQSDSQREIVLEYASYGRVKEYTRWRRNHS